MLPFNLLRYWWLRPLTPDPSHLAPASHDPLKSTSVSSILEPLSGPQFEKPTSWSKISHYYGGSDPIQRSMIEIEKALAQGKDLILVEPETAGQVYYHYISHGWYMLENTIFYGGISWFVSYFFPKLWVVYLPCSFLALVHSYIYFGVYKYDRLSEYQGYDDDKHPVSNLLTAWVLGQRPDHFHFFLKKEKITGWEIISEAVLYLALYSTMRSLSSIETHVIGDGKIKLEIDPKDLTKELAKPISEAGYIAPPEVVRHSPSYYLPSEIPYAAGLFNLPHLTLRGWRIRADSAILSCGLGMYFLYRAFQYFFDDSDETDELGRPWTITEEEKKLIVNQPKWVHGFDTDFDYHSRIILGKDLVPKPVNDEKIKEQEEITRIASQTPYGYVPPGYPENHYGIFT